MFSCKSFIVNALISRCLNHFEFIYVHGVKDIKGTFHAKMGLIKDRNGRNLTEAEDIKKRWQEYTEQLYKIDLNDPDNLDGMMLT